MTIAVDLGRKATKPTSRLANCEGYVPSVIIFPEARPSDMLGSGRKQISAKTSSKGTQESVHFPPA